MTTDAVPLIHVDRHGLDIDEAVAFYERVYSSEDISVGRAGGGRFTWRFRAVGDHEVVVGTSSVEAQRWGTIGKAPNYVLAWTTRPGLAVDTSGRDPIAMEPGVPVMWPSGRDVTFDGEPTTLHTVRFDAPFLESVAAAQRLAVPGPLQFTVSAAPGALEGLRSVIASAAPELLRAETSRGRRAALNMLVAEAVVDAYDVTPTLEVPLHEGPATMRFAQEWMVANAHRPITSTDVSRVTGINARSLQATFQRHAGTSPMAFLRQVRLHRVRAQLVTGDPTETTVATIANAWGFGHLGRFAGYYADTFGELPSETLRRRTR
ncbi:MAG: helix-turn-helix domain-containing protein [Curtobacterium sp.]